MFTEALWFDSIKHENIDFIKSSSQVDPCMRQAYLGSINDVTLTQDYMKDEFFSEAKVEKMAANWLDLFYEELESRTDQNFRTVFLSYTNFNYENFQMHRNI